MGRRVMETGRASKPRREGSIPSWPAGDEQRRHRGDSSIGEHSPRKGDIGVRFPVAPLQWRGGFFPAGGAGEWRHSPARSSRSTESREERGRGAPKSTSGALHPSSHYKNAVRIRSAPLCEHRPTAGPQSSKLMMRVRLPLFAPACLRGSMEERPTSNRLIAGSSPAGGTPSRFSDEDRGLQNRARGFDSLSALRRRDPSFRRGGIHARVYEIRCPGSTPGGRTMSPSSKQNRVEPGS